MSSPQVSKQSYDRRENILRVWHPTPVALDNEQLIRAYFDDIYRFWKQSCGGQRAYYLVNWDGFDVNPHETETYASNVKRIATDCAITIVRYGSQSAIQRTLGRLVAVKIHYPSNVYDTEEKALEVIEGLKNGAVRMGAAGEAR